MNMYVSCQETVVMYTLKKSIKNTKFLKFKKDSLLYGALYRYNLNLESEPLPYNM